MSKNMLKFTTNNLNKVQTLLEAQNYIVRYEKGSFTSGYCLVEHKKIVLINKFYDTEGKINCMLDILSKIEIEESLFEEKHLKWYKKIFDLNGEAEETTTIIDPQTSLF